MLSKPTSTLLSLLLLFFASCGKTSETGKKTGTLPIRAAIVYKLGGAQAVAQNKFYLLNKDLDQIIREKENTRVLIEPGLPGLDLRSDAEVAAGPPPKEEPSIVEKEIKDYIVSTTTTDFEGNGKFENVPTGNYFLVGMTALRAEDEFALWNLPIEVKADNQTLLLSQINGFSGTLYIPKRAQKP